MVNTLSGSYQSSAMVVMRNLRLAELDKNRNIDQQKALIFESETCKYDVILGADFLTKTGIDVKYSTGTIQWFENELPLRNPRFLKDKDYAAMAEISAIHQEMEFFGMDWYDPTCYANEILDAKYEKVHIDDVVDQLNHLNDQQKTDIKQVLEKLPNCLIILQEFTHTGSSTLTWNQEQSQSMLDHILYLSSTWRHSKRN